MDKPDRRIHTEIDMRAYEGYVPDDWCKKTLDAIPKDTVLERLVFDLLMSWRSASYTAQMPATAVRALHAAAVGRSGFVSPDRSVVTYSEQIIARLTQRVPELMDDRPLRAQLLAELATVASEFRDRAASVKDDHPIEPIWATFLGDVSFRLSLWASQRIAYVAFYNAYEAFLVECLKIGTGLPSLRSNDRKGFNPALRTGLGRDISDPCWSHREINIARLVRHALSHSGGRVTEDLRKQNHGVKLIGEDLQIVPADNHRMLRRLRGAVEKVIEVASTDPKFLAPAARLPQPRMDEE